MPEILHRRGELWQHEGVLIKRAAELEYVGIARLEEEIVAEEAGIDRPTLKDKVLRPDRPGPFDHRNPSLVKGTSAGADVVQANRGFALDITVDHQKVSLRAPEFGIHVQCTAS